MAEPQIAARRTASFKQVTGISSEWVTGCHCTPSIFDRIFPANRCWMICMREPMGEHISCRPLESPSEKGPSVRVGVGENMIN